MQLCQYRQVAEAVMRESIINLARIKETYSQSITSKGDSQGIDAVPGLIRGIKAGLLMLNKTRAMNVVEKVGELLVLALSGSGPAYFFLFMEAMISAGQELGLSEEVATRLALQTGLGSSRMALENDVELGELRRRVTSPGGTTERAVQSFEQDKLHDTVARAMRAAADRAVEMAREMG